MRLHTADTHSANSCLCLSPRLASYTTRHFCNPLYSTSLGLQFVRVLYCSFCHLRALVCLFCAVLCLIVIGFSLLFCNNSAYVSFNILCMFVLLFCVFSILCVLCFCVSCLLFLHLYIAVYLLFFPTSLPTAATRWKTICSK